MFRFFPSHRQALPFHELSKKKSFTVIGNEKYMTVLCAAKNFLVVHTQVVMLEPDD
jgi:hypothetical protein